MRLQFIVIAFVRSRRNKCPLRLAGLRDQLVDGSDDLLDLGMGEFDGCQNDFFRLLLRARLDHHDAVLVADNHDVHRGLCALGISGIDDELPIHAAYANGANRGAERNITESQCARLRR